MCAFTVVWMFPQASVVHSETIVFMYAHHSSTLTALFGHIQIGILPSNVFYGILGSQYHF